MREEEGVNLEKDIISQVNDIKKLGKSIASRQSITVQEFQNKMKEKIQALTAGIELDPALIAQETA